MCFNYTKLLLQRKKEIPCACNYIPNNIQTWPLFYPLNPTEQKTVSLLQYSWVMHIYEWLQGTHANIYSMLQIRGLIQSLLHTNTIKGSKWWKARLPRQEQAIIWILQPLVQRNIFWWQLLHSLTSLQNNGNFVK